MYSKERGEVYSWTGGRARFRCQVKMSTFNASPISHSTNWTSRAKDGTSFKVMLPFFQRLNTYDDKNQNQNYVVTHVARSIGRKMHSLCLQIYDGYLMNRNDTPLNAIMYEVT